MYKLCSEAKSGGGNCGAPALKGKTYCYFHDPRRLLAARAARIRYFLEVPLLEHRGAVQAAIVEVTRALGHREIDCELGERLLYALQLASQGKQLGTPIAKQSSPRRLRIAPSPTSRKSTLPAGRPQTRQRSPPKRRNGTSSPPPDQEPRQSGRKRLVFNNLRSNLASR